MAQLPHPTSAYHVFAQKYIERCKQVQKLANLRPSYEHQTFVPNEKPHPIITLDDETNNTQSSSRLLELLSADPPTHQPASTNTHCSLNPEELHITGVSVLREWIDISELDLQKHVSSEVPQAQNCGVQRRRSTNTIPKEKSTSEPHLPLNESSKRSLHVVSTTAEKEDPSMRKRIRKDETIPVEARQSNELLNKRREEDDVRKLRSHKHISTTAEKEDSSRRRRSRKEMRFTFEDGEDSCHEPDEDWVGLSEEEESDEVPDVLTNVREKSLKRKKKVKLRRNQRRRSVLQENTNTSNSISSEETNEQHLFKEQTNVTEIEPIATQEPETIPPVEKKKDSEESEKIDESDGTFFEDDDNQPPTRTKQPTENILDEEKKELGVPNEEKKEDIEHVAFFDDDDDQPPTRTENISVEENKERGVLNEENEKDIEHVAFFDDDDDPPSTRTEQPSESILDEEKTEQGNEDTAQIVEKEDVCESVDEEAQPIPDNEEEEDLPVLALHTSIDENAKPEDPEVEILGDNWADVDVIEVISSDEDSPQKENEEKYKCDQCSYKTNWKSNLSKHVVSRHQTSSEIKWFECAHCPYRGKTREYLRSHLRQTHEQFITWHNCTKCHLKFKAKQFLDYHMLAVHTAPENIQWLKCDECDFKCKTKMRLKEHKLNKHTSEDEIKWYRCKVCKYKGKTKKSLSRHEKNKHVEYDQMEWFKCDKCDYEGSDRLYLRKHVKQNHPEVIQLEREDISDKQLECKMCGVKMFSKSKFLEHFRWSKDCYF